MLRCGSGQLEISEKCLHHAIGCDLNALRLNVRVVFHPYLTDLTFPLADPCDLVRVNCSNRQGKCRFDNIRGLPDRLSTPKQTGRAHGTREGRVSLRAPTVVGSILQVRTKYLKLIFLSTSNEVCGRICRPALDRLASLYGDSIVPVAYCNAKQGYDQMRQEKTVRIDV